VNLYRKNDNNPELLYCIGDDSADSSDSTFSVTALWDIIGFCLYVLRKPCKNVRFFFYSQQPISTKLIYVGSWH